MGQRSIATPNSAVWEMRVEHHFALIALRDMIQAHDQIDDAPTIDPALRSRLIAVRDLLEHWNENLPVFNAGEGAPGYRSGKWFAAEHPGDTPFLAFMNWNSTHGPMIAPDTPASEVREVLDAMERYVLQRHPQLSDFLPERAASPWLGGDDRGDRWYPRDVGPAGSNSAEL